MKLSRFLAVICLTTLITPTLVFAQTNEATGESSNLELLVSEKANYEGITEQNNDYYRFNKFDPTFQLSPPEADDPMMVIETNVGTIIVKLFPDRVPETFERMSSLINEGFYDAQTDEEGNTTHITFHRVIDDFMIQTGDPLSRDDIPENDGTGGTGEDFNDEFDEELRNIRGSLSMANSGENTNDSQFFLNQADRNMFLDFKHTVWGQTYAGLNIIDYIATLPKDETGEKLVDTVYIENIDIVPYSEEIDALLSGESTTAETPATEDVVEDTPSGTQAPFQQTWWYQLLRIVFWVLVVIVVVLIVLFIFIRMKLGGSSQRNMAIAGSSSKKKRKKQSKQFGKMKKRRK